MDRRSLGRLLLIGAAIFLVMQFAVPALFGGGETKLQPLDVEDSLAAPAEERAQEQLCSLSGPRFEVELSSRGASLRKARMLDQKYSLSVEQPDTRIDLVTTSLESRMPLRTTLRLPGGEAPQVELDDVDWALVEATSEACVFRYEDERTTVDKRVALTGRAFELAVSLEVKNRGTDERRHRLAIEQTSWRTAKEMEGSLGMQSEHLTELVLHTTDGTKRLSAGDFDPGDFEDDDFTRERWRRAPGEAIWAAAASSYFAMTVIHVEGPAAPAAEAQAEERWDPSRYQKRGDDPQAGHVYRARLAYPEQTLEPGGSRQYEVLAFLGPKERTVLGAVGGPGPSGEDDRYGTSELINLGWFGVIGRILVGYIYWLHGKVGSWGWSIVLLTITVRMVVFPLSLSQIKSAFHMRRLKPHMDEINAKYKGDATQRGLAMQELWRKEGVANPMIGCLPLLLQMPVWFALYTSLHTAVELYHTPFGPVMPDLSQPGKYYIIPVVLGASSFLQQKLMPPQGDPMQQKMMLYMMPGVFTVMMLFLPAGLGVYMLTNTWPGIGQQLLVERWMKRRLPKTTITVRDKPSAEASKAADEEPGEEPLKKLGAPRSKARVRG